jgi:hypothetical protein
MRSCTPGSKPRRPTLARPPPPGSAIGRCARCSTKHAQPQWLPVASCCGICTTRSRRCDSAGGYARSAPSYRRDRRSRPVPQRQSGPVAADRPGAGCRRIPRCPLSPEGRPRHRPGPHRSRGTAGPGVAGATRRCWPCCSCCRPPATRSRGTGVPGRTRPARAVTASRT